MVVHLCNPSPPDPKAGRSQVQDQLVLHGETLFKKKKERKNMPFHLSDFLVLFLFFFETGSYYIDQAGLTYLSLLRTRCVPPCPLSFLYLCLLIC
jgi:hypothetical protein